MSSSGDRKRYLALDLMSVLGWACRAEDGHVVYGTETFKSHFSETPGLRWMKFRNWLKEMTALTKPEIIFFEEVKGFPFKNRSRDSKIYYGFEAHLFAFCEAASLECRGVGVNQIKKFISGNGNASKDAVMIAVKSHGFRPTDNNQSDAIALLLYAESGIWMKGLAG